MLNVNIVRNKYFIEMLMLPSMANCPDWTFL